MKRWLKVLLAAIAALVVLLVLNAVVSDRQTKRAEVTVDGGRIVPLGAGDLQIVDTGPRDGQPVVLLHCYTCAIDWWDGVIPRLERTHRVIAIDLLGHGGSEKPGSGYSISDQAQLVSQVLGQLRVRDATVVGHSLGGAVATALAEQAPDLVGAVGIIDTEPDTGYGSLDLLARAVYVPVIGEALWRVKMDWSIRKGLEEAFAPGYDVPDQFVDDVKQMTYTSYSDSHSAFDSYVGESPLDQRLGSIDVPKLVVFGARDQIVDPPREALSAYADVPDTETALIQGAGHSPNVEKPAEISRLILRLAEEVRAVPAATSKPAPGKTASSPGKVVARCGQAIIGAGRPNYKKQSTLAGPVGLFGGGRNLSRAQKIGTAFVTKIPLIVEGHGAVVVRVPATEKGRVGLIYGPVNSARAVDQAATQVTFEPCRDKPRTVWPGGLALADRKPITLEVVAGGSVKKLRVG
jgi:pimeloyl-ACP methyl ester carboxylesterase